jgi:hypothetical protein
MVPSTLRSLGLAAALGLGLACGSGAGPAASANGSAAACTSETLAACEDAVASAVRSGDAVGPLIVAYANARKEKNPDDAVPGLVAALTEAGKKGRAAIVVARGAPRAPSDALAVDADASFSAVRPANEPAIYLAIAEAAGLDYLAVVRATGETDRYFPRDPLAPMMLGLFAHARETRPPASLATDAAIESALRRATLAARAFRYVEAAKAIDDLDGLVASRPPFDPQTVRARLFSTLLGMSKPTPLFGDSPPRPAIPEPSPTDTPYVDVLRVRTDAASAKAYAKRRAHIHAALPQELHAGTDALFAEEPAGCEAYVPPPLKTVRELAFARLLPGALKPARARAAAGRLDFAPWYARYADLVATVERTESGFLLAPVLVMERGGASGVIPAGSDVHRRASRIALRHAKALAELASAMPSRVGLAHSGFFLSGGSYVDTDLAAAVVDAGRNAASGVLSTSNDPWEVLGATLASAFLAFSMPPELQQAHLTALQGAFAAKLRGELAKQSGWGVAAAFTLDALYRLAFDMGPDLRSSAEQVSRALEADGVESPALASLTSALVRYAVLAERKELGSPVIEREAPLPGRAAAKSALGKAVARLGDGASAPSPQALEDMTLLLDGAAATLALFVAEAIRGDTAAKPAAKSGPKDACVDESSAVDPRVVRALGKLADLRRTVLQNKTIREGTDAWSTRARALALVVSDLVDLAQASTRPVTKGRAGAKAPLIHPTTFFVSRSETGPILLAALASFGADKPSSEAIASGYALLRAVAEGKAETFDATTLGEAKTFLGALGALFTESEEMSETGALFAILARAISGEVEASPAFVEVARSLYAKGSREQADTVLLFAVLIASIQEKAVHPTALALADEQKSEMAWVLKFLREVRRIADRERLEPASFAPGLDAFLAKSCIPAKAEVVSDLLAAIDAHRGGDRQAARLALDAWLDRAEKDLVIPRVSFVFKQETAARVFNLTLDVGLAGLLISGANGVNLGAGARSSREPLLSLSKTVEPIDSKRSRDEAARAFIHAAALAGVMHFVAGDPQRGEIAAARAIAAASQRTRLYLEGVTDEPISWTADSSATLVLLGQLAADSGRPFLAGSLLSLARESMGTAAKPEDFQKLLDPLPPLLADMGADAAVARAKKTLATLPAGLPCGGRRADTAALLHPSCEGYAEALALRIADATVALPDLDAKSVKRGCADFSALDAFLEPAAKGTYEPDRLMTATTRLLDADKPYEAATLLTKHRQPSHCTPQLLGLVRGAAARLERAPALHADLMSVAVNCEAQTLSPALVTDLEALDKDLDRLGDPPRRLDVSLFAAKLALVHGSADPLRAVVDRPDFVSRARESGAGPLGLALLLDHAASALAGANVRVKATQDDVDLLCGRSPPADRLELCKLLDPLRNESSTADARKKAAEAALRKLLGP